jgi:uncharacterized membrane protein
VPHRPATLFIILTVTSGFGAVAVAAALAAVLRRVRPLARLRFKRDAAPFVAALAAAFFLALTVATIARHRAFATNGYDLGEYANFIYQFGRGHFFVQTILPSENFHPLSLTPLLALLAPATYVLGEPEYLLLLQAGALAAGVYLTFWAARAPGSSGWAAAALAASFALSPALHGAAFHAALPRTYALPLVVAAYGFFARGRFGPGVLCAALVALCREDLALHAVGLAVFGGFATGRRRAGVAVAAVFALYFIVLGSVLYPRWTQPGGRPYYAVFADVKALAAGPAWLKVAFVAAKVGYLAVLCLPTAALWSRAGAALITWVTPLAVPLLAMRPGIFAVGSQYPAAVLPFVYGAAAFALRRWPAPAAGVKSRSAPVRGTRRGGEPAPPRRGVGQRHRRPAAARVPRRRPRPGAGGGRKARAAGRRRLRGRAPGAPSLSSPVLLRLAQSRRLPVTGNAGKPPGRTAAGRVAGRRRNRTRGPEVES